MSLLTAQLRQASFRGVPFAVTSASNNAGRRTQLHEYPLRDTPYVEDLGRATRTYSLTAIVAGTDYIYRTKRLMAALEKSGPGKLVHPWLGELNVVPSEVGQVNFDRNLGQATVALKFVEAGALENPSVAKNWLQNLREQIDSAVDKAQEIVDDVMEVVNVSDSVVSDVTQAWGAIQHQFNINAFATQSGIAKSIDLINLDSSGSIAVLAANAVRALDCSKLVGTDTNFGNGSKNLITICESDALVPVHTDGLIDQCSDQISETNVNALKAFMRQTLIIEAAGCASVCGTDDDGSDVSVSYDFLIDVRDSVCNAIDDEILLTDDDEMAQILESLRASTHQALTERARGEARLIRLPVQTGMPLVVVAYQQYGDAERADELARLNAVRNIGFAPAGGLVALSDRR